MLPNQNILDQVNQKIKCISNKQGEYLRKIHYCCYLLCSQSGLRISEAVKFDLLSKTKQGLYRINKPKGKQERLVYVPKQVINELKENNWKPGQTNRHSFYHFLQKIKQELKISKKIELTPHTLRRSFTTHHANSGLPLPLLQKMLGHSSPRTTALYWKNVHGDGDNTTDILAGKKWLEDKKAPPRSPSVENFSKLSPRNSEPITKNKPVINDLKPSKRNNSLLLIKAKEKPTIANYQPKPLNSEISPKNQEQFSLNSDEEFPTIINQEKPQIQQDLTKKDKVIEQLKRELIQEQEKRTIAENNLTREKEHNQSLQQTNTNLTQKIQVYEQNYSNLQIAYQNTLKDKQTAEKQLYQLTSELKNLAKMLGRWQKINYYRQLEQELKAQIVQPPPWKHWKN